MPLTIADRGEHNTIHIPPSILAEGNGVIVLNGNRATLEIADGCMLNGVSITLGDDCALMAEANCRLAALEVYAAGGGRVRIGSNSNFTDRTRLFLHEPSTITIGRDCLFAADTLLCTSDMHSVLDRDTGKRINPPADIAIGDKVWIGHGVSVMKGTVIGTGAAIGIASVVTGMIDPFTMSAGSPARCRRRNITWDARLLPL
ncbi:acyltransferase [Acidisphaera sp. L21]|uniref:acyltransferase n=1 Tax=Acidisphaera sp. L21 TaxID=1641851 RepID=UPI00131AA471|nr:acyltransferase [Acidisphaera sp. L21]